MSIFIETTGQGQDVVLLHGCTDNHAFLKPIHDQLAQHYRVTWLDQPGIDNSAWQPQINSCQDMATALMPLLPKEAIYMGWSYGGLLATAIASLYPERTQQLVLLASTPQFVEDDNWPGIPKPGFHQALMPDIQQNGLSIFLNAFIDQEFAEMEPKPDVFHQIKNYFPADDQVNVEAISKRLQLVDQTDLRAQFKQLQCPIDLIFGERDSAVPAQLHPHIMALNPNARKHVIAGAQHMPFATHPEAFNQVLAEIFSDYLYEA